MPSTEDRRQKTEDRGQKRRGRFRRRLVLSRKGISVLGGLIIILLYLFIFGDSGLLPRYLKQREILHLRSEIKKVGDENLSLEREITDLKKNPLRATKEAREVLGMVGKGECPVEFINRNEVK